MDMKSLTRQNDYKKLVLNNVQ